MKLRFYKYQGTGNDFILLDNRNSTIHLTTSQIAFLCNRHLGIGADGLMLLELTEGHDFRMVYYNADGNESTMCGNGGRCITAFAKKLGVIKDNASFIAIDGPHTSVINADGTISLHMQDVEEMNIAAGFTELNTGSPHYVAFTDDVLAMDVVNEGRNVRHLNRYEPKGINVNFAQRLADGLRVRTYERGVEDETLSCGTGVTAAAIAASGKETGVFNTEIQTPGGRLNVAFIKNTPLSAHDVILSGLATYVFEGEIEL